MVKSIAAHHVSLWSLNFTLKICTILYATDLLQCNAMAVTNHRVKTKCYCAPKKLAEYFYCNSVTVNLFFRLFILKW